MVRFFWVVPTTAAICRTPHAFLIIFVPCFLHSRLFRKMSTISNLEDELALVSVNESNSSTYDILLKIMALGDTGVGKSCFLVQYVEGRFMMKYVTTVGVDFFLRKLVRTQKPWGLQVHLGLRFDFK